jgi:hypothetical protein
MTSKQFFVTLLIVSFLPVWITAAENWYRGNTHVHTALSGHGDSSPEFVAKWYHDRGYNFLILSEHNKFIDPKGVTLPEDKRENFILIPGQEITGKPVGVHTTAMNIDGLIDWTNKETDSKGYVIQDHIRKTVDAGGQPILNHPHGGSSITDAMKRGDFYASNGIMLKTCKRGPKLYVVEVDVEKTRDLVSTLPEWAGLETREAKTGYRIEFIGLGGKTLQATNGPEASFSLKKLDTYARVRVVFTRKKGNVMYEEFFAWGQPVFSEN